MKCSAVAVRVVAAVAFPVGLDEVVECFLGFTEVFGTKMVE